MVFLITLTLLIPLFYFQVWIYGMLNQIEVSGVVLRMEFCEVKWINCLVILFLFVCLFRFLKIIYLFIYFWLHWVLVSVRGLSLVAASGDHSSSRCAGLSLSRPFLLRSTGSRHAGSVVVAHGPSCSVACGIFPDQGSNPCPLHWQADSQPLHHQGSLAWLFLIISWVRHITQNRSFFHMAFSSDRPEVSNFLQYENLYFFFKFYYIFFYEVVCVFIFRFLGIWQDSQECRQIIYNFLKKSLIL